MTNTRVYLNHMALINALGSAHTEVLSKLIAGDTSGMQPFHSELMGTDFLAGQVSLPLPVIPNHLPQHNTRNNRLILHCLQQLQSQIEALLSQYSASRIGVVMGTSTSGIAEGEYALVQQCQSGAFPGSFDYSQIEMASPANFINDYLELGGPAYSISTACSSSGKVFASARSLIDNDICDAVIVGGADSICDMTLNGFDALEAIAKDLSLPFSKNRCGINIGEGAALFIMSRDKGSVELKGVGESSDAHHISAPHPQGNGAIRAMQMALAEARLSAEEIHYLNLHGTGTELNDSMESQACNQVLTNHTWCSSTKPLTGHTLGAAGATELAFCWLLLQQSDDYYLPLHAFDGDYDPELPALNLVGNNQSVSKLTNLMSNSFAFGGNNVSVIISRS